MTQWLRLCSFTAESVGSIPGQGTKIPQTANAAKKKREREKEKENKLTITKGGGRGINL